MLILCASVHQINSVLKLCNNHNMWAGAWQKQHDYTFSKRYFSIIRCSRENALGPWLPIICAQQESRILFRLDGWSGWSASSLWVLVGFISFTKQHVRHSMIPKFCQHLRFLLYNFDSFCPILFKFTPHLNPSDIFDRKIGLKGQYYKSYATL